MAMRSARWPWPARTYICPAETPEQGQWPIVGSVSQSRRAPLRIRCRVAEKKVRKIFKRPEKKKKKKTKLLERRCGRVTVHPKWGADYESENFLGQLDRL